MAILVKGSQQYAAAVSMFGQQFVDDLIAKSQDKSKELIEAGVEFKTFGGKFYRFWQSTRAPVATKAVVSAASLYFGR